MLVAAGCASAEQAIGPLPVTVVDVAPVPESVVDPVVVAPEVVDPASADASTTMVRAPVVIGFAGDTNFVGGRNGDDPLGAVTDLLSRPDLMIVNLETAVADDDVGLPPVEKAFLFKSAPESLRFLTDAGVDVVTLANNHTLDFGPEALAQTLEEVDASGLLRVGAGLDEAAAYTPLIVPVGDWQIGLVSLSRVPCDWSASGENLRPQVAWACPPFMALVDEAVAQAAAVADVVIVMVHGGEEGALCPSGFMVDLREHWANLGVDLVVDGHPHVVQGLRRFGDTLVVNSTGNFAFPPAQSFSANSAVFLATVSDEGISLRVEPVRVPGGVAAPATDAQRAEIFAQINGVSTGLRVDDNGTVVDDPAWVGACQ